jgi:hypothetical protein
MNPKHFLLSVLGPCVAIAAALPCHAQNPVIYKHVDANGRVTYANAPMKGANVLELAPLLVVPSPARPTVAAASSAPRVSLGQPADSTGQPKQAEQPDVDRPVASVTTQPPQARVDLARKLEAAETPIPAGVTADTGQSFESANPSRNAALIAQQRRSEVRRRIIEGEIDAETQFLAEAKEVLQREQNKSAAMRSLRAAIVANERSANGRLAAKDDSAETRALIERHFERVRDLQDQVSMHEGNLAELRAQLPSPSSANPSQLTSLRPAAVAKVSTRPNMNP